MSDDPCTTAENVHTCLTKGQSIGLALTAESGLISLTSLLVLVTLIVRNVYRNSKRPRVEQRRLVQEPTDVLMLSLFAADFLQGIGAAMNIRWAHTGYVHTGGFCAAQGSIQQLGEASVAMTTLAIALQTFVAVCFRKFVHDIKPAIAIVIFIWTYVILFVSIGAGVNGSSNYYVPTPYWCWIGANFSQERIFGEYFWLWLTLFVSIFVYVPLFLWGNGYLKVDKTHWWKVSCRLQPKALSEEENARDRPPSLSLAILGYPVLYSILILPLSVARWITFSGSSPEPSAATFAAVFIFGLSGAANVLLLLTTRPNLLLFDSEPELYPVVVGGACAMASDVGRLELAHEAPSPSARTNTRGRRRRLHEKGRIATPSRSSSRGTTHTHAHAHGYGYAAAQPDEDLYTMYGAYAMYAPRREDDLGAVGLRGVGSGGGLLALDRGRSHSRSRSRSRALRMSDETEAETRTKSWVYYPHSPEPTEEALPPRSELNAPDPDGFSLRPRSGQGLAPSPSPVHSTREVRTPDAEGSRAAKVGVVRSRVHSAEPEREERTT
ncbi:hypothetical protein M0805_008000 [Coniferiporia weirii]|nr:hypothetical protein M0805_008000 [Coniferiporia weirii]